MAKLDRHQGREPIKSFNTMSKRKPDDEPADGDGRGHWLFGGVAALFGGGGS